MDHMFLAYSLYINIYMITLHGKKWDVTLPLGKQFTKYVNLYIPITVQVKLVMKV